MSLSCYCDDYYPEPGDVCWFKPDDYTEYNRPRACRCKSCGARIAPGDLIIAFERFKVPDGDVECAIYGEEGEIYRAPIRFCETCADLWLSLDALGFCVTPYDDMRELVRDYAALYGPKKEADQ